MAFIPKIQSQSAWLQWNLRWKCPFKTTGWSVSMSKKLTILLNPLGDELWGYFSHMLSTINLNTIPVCVKCDKCVKLVLTFNNMAGWLVCESMDRINIIDVLHRHLFLVQVFFWTWTSRKMARNPSVWGRCCYQRCVKGVESITRPVWPFCRLPLALLI